MRGSIFISYRRDDSYAASAIHDQLAARFGRDRVFRDIESLQPGTDWAQAIGDAVRQATVCLVIIGPSWFSAKDQRGARRIDNPRDFVRSEIETAFAEGKQVIPVLVGDARLPGPDELPGSLQRLSQLNAVTLRNGRDFAGNIERLTESIERFFGSPGKGSVLPKSIGPEPAPPPPTPAPAIAEPTRRSLTNEQASGKVFISYRREGGAETARLLRYELLARGWKVFLDVEDLKGGTFDETLLREVAGAGNFLLILSPKALERCVDENDWLRREIQQAIETERNIVPVVKEGAFRPEKEALPQEIEPLKRFNCVDYSHVYYDSMVTRLLSFLKRMDA